MRILAKPSIWWLIRDMAAQAAGRRWRLLLRLRRVRTAAEDSWDCASATPAALIAPAEQHGEGGVAEGIWVWNPHTPVPAVRWWRGYTGGAHA